MLILLKKMTIFVNFLKKMSSFCQFFDSQMAIFRRVRSWLLILHFLNRNLLNEYKDCVQRAQRLSVVRESLMLNRPESSVSALNMEDLLIYLRWLVCHLHSMKRFNQYLKVSFAIYFIKANQLTSHKMLDNILWHIVYWYLWLIKKLS